MQGCDLKTQIGFIKINVLSDGEPLLVNMHIADE